MVGGGDLPLNICIILECQCIHQLLLLEKPQQYSELTKQHSRLFCYSHSALSKNNTRFLRAPLESKHGLALMQEESCTTHKKNSHSILCSIHFQDYTHTTLAPTAYLITDTCFFAIYCASLLSLSSLPPSRQPQSRTLSIPHPPTTCSRAPPSLPRTPLHHFPSRSFSAAFQTNTHLTIKIRLSFQNLLLTIAIATSQVTANHEHNIIMPTIFTSSFPPCRYCIIEASFLPKLPMPFISITVLSHHTPQQCIPPTSSCHNNHCPKQGDADIAVLYFCPPYHFVIITLSPAPQYCLSTPHNTHSIHRPPSYVCLLFFFLTLF